MTGFSSGGPGPIAFIVILQLVVSPALGGGVREFQDSWLLNRDDSWNLLEGVRSLEMVFLARPTFAMGTGQSRLFSMPDLEQIQVNGWARTRIGNRPFQLACSWQQLGKGLYRETATLVSFMMGRSPGVGIRLRRTTTDLAGRAEPTGQGLDLVLGHLAWLDQDTLIRGRFALPLVGNDVEKGSLIRRTFLVLSLIRSRGALNLQVDRRADGTPVLGFDLFWTVGGGVGVSLRADPPTGSLGPGIYLRRGILLLRTSHLAHPDLGQTHRFSLTLTHVHE